MMRIPENVKNTIYILAVIFVFLFLVKIFDVSYPLTVTNTNKSTELSVVGEGKVEVTPDKATVNVGVTVQNAATVDAAQTQINEVNNKLVQAVSALGVKKEDVKTSNYSIYPNYSSAEPLLRGGTEISGYNGNASISVTVRNIALVPQILSAATEAGANEVQGVNYEVDDPNKAREEARNKAIANARLQAQNLAKTLGIRLGRVTNIVEASTDGGNIYPMYAREAAIGAPGVGGAPDVQPGSQTITSVVTLYFEKK